VRCGLEYRVERISRPLALLIVAVVLAGSSPVTDAQIYSWRDAQSVLGLMPRMPATADDLNEAKPCDSTQNVRGGLAYLRQLIDLSDDHDECTLANASPEVVMRHGNQMPPVRETRDDNHGPTTVGHRGERVNDLQELRHGARSSNSDVFGHTVLAPVR
jgi:hypothetical protein